MADAAADFRKALRFICENSETDTVSGFVDFMADLAYVFAELRIVATRIAI
jgi:hypothetical protein